VRGYWRYECGQQPGGSGDRHGHRDGLAKPSHDFVTHTDFFSLTVLSR
jgi:hypothetical protein